MLLSTFGSARWTGAAAARVRTAAEILSINLEHGAATIVLPVAVAASGDLSATVRTEAELTDAKNASTEVLIIRNICGNAAEAEAPLPGTSTQGTVTFAPAGNDVVLTWNLTLLRP